VVGPFNELPQAASWAVSKNPGFVYNPLFVYGGVGLGKTHLLQAVGNEVLQNLSDKKVKYIPCEKFTSGIISSIRDGTIENFKLKYRMIDILIIDDVQFLAGKEKTQEEFFHIFNALYEKNKQIILSSDRSPKAIPSLAERLRSRFEGGMIADIGYPDFETRVAILKTKAKEKRMMDIDGISRLVKSITDPDVLREIYDKIAKLDKWYDSVRLQIKPPDKKPKVMLYRKTPREIGEPLEDLVEVALRSLGCMVVPNRGIIWDEYGSQWIFDKKRKRWVLRFRTVFDIPSFEEEGKFEEYRIVFARLPTVKDKPDFESRKIAIEVKNRDPAYPYRTYAKFKEEVLDRFKKVRKKKRYLLIPEGVINNEQRKVLKRRKIGEVNLKEQLRINNQKEVYKDLFYRLEQILSTHLKI
jgi:hypothetical protein